MALGSNKAKPATRLPERTVPDSQSRMERYQREADENLAKASRATNETTRNKLSQVGQILPATRRNGTAPPGDQRPDSKGRKFKN